MIHAKFNTYAQPVAVDTTTGAQVLISAENYASIENLLKKIGKYTDSKAYNRIQIVALFELVENGSIIAPIGYKK